MSRSRVSNGALWSLVYSILWCGYIVYFGVGIVYTLVWVCSILWCGYTVYFGVCMQYTLVWVYSILWYWYTVYSGMGIQYTLVWVHSMYFGLGTQYTLVWVWCCAISHPITSSSPALSQLLCAPHAPTLLSTVRLLCASDAIKFETVLREPVAAT